MSHEYIYLALPIPGNPSDVRVKPGEAAKLTFYIDGPQIHVLFLFKPCSLIHSFRITNFDNDCMVRTRFKQIVSFIFF